MDEWTSRKLFTLTFMACIGADSKKIIIFAI